MSAGEMPSDGEERIEVVPSQQRQGLWVPTAGEEAYALLTRRLPNDSRGRESVLTSALEILSQCIPPTAPPASRTGLVVGYVQSGKTLSFTTVAALANDNHYRIVVVIAGMTNDLAVQSRDRLRNELGLEETPFTRWQHYHNPGPAQTDEIRDVLHEWHDPHVRQDERRTVLITVLKNHTRLRNLNQLLTRLGQDAAVPTLVVDDEADQASLNNLVRQAEFSTTYSRIRSLQNCLPHHTFLQYTATPQANLLINLIDVLSPETVEVLDPGPNYVGGETLLSPDSPYVCIIPPNEIPNRNHPFDDPPDSLCEALALFFVGVASGLHRRDARPGNRSMMVHPSRYIAGHQQYFNWIRQIRNVWMDALQGNLGVEERTSLIADFQDAHTELSQTADDLEPFDELEPRLLNAIRRTQLRELNTQSDTREIRWNSNYSWILVGGQVLDRGFTVEGLTITYMPRGRGVGNADTIQQRARFLGYKGEYLGFCRIYLESLVAVAYQAYVAHEEDIRQRLIDHAATGRPLAEFRRAFICDRALRPTRQSVLDIPYDRPSFSNGWYRPATAPNDEIMVTDNRLLINSFLAGNELPFAADPGSDQRSDIMRHRVAHCVSLQLVYDELLARYEVRNMEDDHKWIVALLLADRELSTNPHATCSVFEMSYDFDQNRSLERRRQVRDGRIVNLMQGPAPDRRGAVYPGDRHIHSDADLTLQIHNVTFTDGPVNSGPVLIERAPIIAIWMPPAICQDVVVQPQGGI